MANKDDAQRKLVQLATRVKGGITTYTEDLILRRAVDTGKIKSRSDVAKVLEESLSKPANDVQKVLASDDSDRLADEIVNLLNG